MVTTEKIITLNNGEKMPKCGLGLWKGGDSSDIEAAIDNALEAGYRLFDTAFFYQTENILGKSVNKWIGAGKGKREDLFIITKLPWNGMEPKLVEHFLNLSLKELNLTYIDLYLIHWPSAVKYTGDRNFFPVDSNQDIILDKTTDLEAIWKAMEDQVDAKRVKSIGVSNFTTSQIERIVKMARIPPTNNQVEVHAYFQQKELIKFCTDRGVSITAYSPLGGPWRKTFPGSTGDLPNCVNLLDDPVVKEIGEKYKKTSGQILLRYLLELGVAVVPKSSHVDRLKQNIDVFDFEFDSDDLKKLEALENKESGRSNLVPKNMKGHPEAPF